MKGALSRVEKLLRPLRRVEPVLERNRARPGARSGGGIGSISSLWGEAVAVLRRVGSGAQQVSPGGWPGRSPAIWPCQTSPFRVPAGRVLHFLPVVGETGTAPSRGGHWAEKTAKSRPRQSSSRRARARPAVSRWVMAIERAVRAHRARYTRPRMVPGRPVAHGVSLHPQSPDPAGSKTAGAGRRRATAPRPSPDGTGCRFATPAQNAARSGEAAITVVGQPAGVGHRPARCA